MKIFWSWQSDTPGKIGRHVVRDALTDAIEILKEPGNVEEPAEREDRERLTLDHDRKGVPGSPDLAATIFKKIEDADVFVCDVTLVGTVDRDKRKKNKKRVINANVAIEYGYAHHALGDLAILMVQNIFYGAREGLPFDLRHKAGPITFELSPAATKSDITAARLVLARTLAEALRPYLGQKRVAEPFAATASTSGPAFFWKRGEVLVRTRQPGLKRFRDEEEGADYLFADSNAFYLRLMPVTAQTALGVAELHERVNERRPQLLERSISGAFLGRNEYGTIHYLPHASTAMLRALTQVFRTREIWGVSREFIVHHGGQWVVPIGNVRRIFARVLSDYIEFARTVLDLEPPFAVELGAVGLRDQFVTLPDPNPYHETTGPIHDDVCIVRRVLNDPDAAAQQQTLDAFIGKIHDLSGLTR